jgi:hypothetical protein
VEQKISAIAALFFYIGVNIYAENLDDLTKFGYKTNTDADLSIIEFIVFHEITQKKFKLTKENKRKLCKRNLQVFSWAIHNYLNQFTQFKTPSGNFASDEQCRLIYTILNDAEFMNDNDEPDMESYIRVYLKQWVRN